MKHAATIPLRRLGTSLIVAVAAVAAVATASAEIRLPFPKAGKALIPPAYGMKKPAPKPSEYITPIPPPATETTDIVTLMRQGRIGVRITAARGPDCSPARVDLLINRGQYEGRIVCQAGLAFVTTNPRYPTLVVTANYAELKTACSLEVCAFGHNSQSKYYRTTLFIIQPPAHVPAVRLARQLASSNLTRKQKQRLFIRLRYKR